MSAPGVRKHLDLWSDYKDWLLWRVHFSRPKYGNLMNFLHNTDFRWSVPHDENRAADGTMYRDEFFESCSVNKGDFNRPCSVLEMLVGLSIRIDNEYIGDPAEEKPDIIFWEMIENLELDRYNNSHWDSESVDEIITGWLDREFSSDGEGSIFPIKDPFRDQRDIEIWSQMNDYIEENY